MIYIRVRFSAGNYIVTRHDGDLTSAREQFSPSSWAQAGSLLSVVSVEEICREEFLSDQRRSDLSIAIDAIRNSVAAIKLGNQRHALLLQGAADRLQAFRDTVAPCDFL